MGVALQVKRIDESNWYVIGDGFKPLKVKQHKEKDKFWLECRCFMYNTTQVCRHTEVIMTENPEIPWKEQKLKAQVEVAEFIGDDISGVLYSKIKDLSY